MNNHYKKVIDKQNVAEVTPKEEPIKHSQELGNIETYMKPLEIPEPESTQEAEEKREKELAKVEKTTDIKDIKSKLNKNLMMALQSQNIQQHLDETHKKADFLKKSIANSIQMQEDLLEKRLREGKKKKISLIAKDNLSNANTVETSSEHQRKIVRKG
jgi:preprotein translocase subunit SecD